MGRSGSKEQCAIWHSTLLRPRESEPICGAVRLLERFDALGIGPYEFCDRSGNRSPSKIWTRRRTRVHVGSPNTRPGDHSVFVLCCSERKGAPDARCGSGYRKIRISAMKEERACGGYSGSQF